MFEGEKTLVFWLGLIILGLASVELFGMLWLIEIWEDLSPLSVVKTTLPLIVGGVVFILIGLYMMKSGVKKSGKED